jgi:non-heme Fe2+,alpha-ketoglutarate-dependent halogenase
MSEHDERIKTLTRELKFFPIVTPNPKRLTNEQISFFNTKGYLSPFTIFEGAAVEKNRRDFDAILQKFLDAGKDSYAIDRYHDRIQAIYDLAKTPAILDIVEDLLGPNFVCWATHYFCKLPGDDKGVSWHQDCTYWPLTPTKTITVWLAIDDADKENGCMEVVPGSHLQGGITHKESNMSEKNVLTQTVADMSKYSQPVALELKAGQISIHSDLTIHGSLPNRSNRRRCGLTLRYCPTDVRAFWDWNNFSIMCRGSDPTRHWASLPRPSAEFTL